MKEKPILFSGPMVRAILDGRKTQTRRVVKPQPEPGTDCPYHIGDGSERKARACPYGQPGSTLWVRETWCEASPEHRDNAHVRQAFYKTCTSSEGEEIRREYIRLGHDYRWKSSRFMPRWASRITLEVTGVRAERLQEICAEDAISEGIERVPQLGILRASGWKDYSAASPGFMLPEQSYRSLWESINGAGSWDANPFVWVVEFKRIETNHTNS